jgi:excisionase family DNA binding protein
MSTATASRKWLSKQEAADYLGVSLMSLRRLTEQGKLSTYHPVAGRAVYKIAELDAHVESTKNTPSSRSRP